MPGKMFAIVGSWFYRPGPKGVTILEYHPEDGSLNLIETKFRGLNADHMVLDNERKTAYFVDTCATERGGYVVAVKISPETGQMEVFSRKETLFRDPNYLWIDEKEHQYALVTHHSNTVLVNHLVRREDGTFDSEAFYDDVGLVLFRLEPDGGFGEICDVALTSTKEAGEQYHRHHKHQEGHAYSRQHSVTADPGGKLFIVCDKGLDKIYTFHLDRERGKLIPKKTVDTGHGSHPRYGVFHREQPIFYCNHEGKTSLASYRFDAGTGELEKLCETPLLSEETEQQPISGKLEAAALIMHPDGRHIYASVRGADCVAVLEVEPDGNLKLQQNITCGGQGPRALCISPDGAYLLCANTDSQMITTLAINEDGTLQETNQSVQCPLPACMAIMQSSL